MTTARQLQARLQALQRIARLMRDRDLAHLGHLSAQKRNTEALLAALDGTPGQGELNAVVAAQVTDRFGLWATNRRILLNQQLARQTVSWIEGKTAARQSLGRHEVIEKLNKRL